MGNKAGVDSRAWGAFTVTAAYCALAEGVLFVLHQFHYVPESQYLPLSFIIVAVGFLHGVVELRWHLAIGAGLCMAAVIILGLQLLPALSIQHAVVSSHPECAADIVKTADQAAACQKVVQEKTHEFFEFRRAYILTR